MRRARRAFRTLGNRRPRREDGHLGSRRRLDLDTTQGRGAWATVIGNAVPPLLGVHLVEPLLCALPQVDRRGAPTTADTTGVHLPAKDAGRRRRNGVPAASSELIRIRMTNT